MVSKSCRPKLSHSVYRLAYFSLNGKGVKKDEIRAYDLAQKSAINGHGDAVYLLKKMYHNGNFVRKDLLELFCYCGKPSN